MTDPALDPFVVDEDVHERVADALMPFLRPDAFALNAAEAAVSAYRNGPRVEDVEPDVHAFERRRAVVSLFGGLLAKRLPGEVFERVDVGALEQDLGVAAAGVYEPVIAAVSRDGVRPDNPKLAARLSDPHAHACISCSPDGVTPGPGCHNCRRTGMDQTPCRTEGHLPQCPHGCCGGPRTSGSAVAWPQGATDA